ncbi:MAG TPA: oligosaccharide flippase family protein [Solirubrobacterales bacterium]|nr:oligosaccharide flippase family protein [Solirubrobacterales bacterium]
MADEAQVSRNELREATLDGVRWITITRIAFEFVAAGGAVALAHLVPPAAYGRYAIALVLPEIALSLVNEGLGTPLVQRQTLTKRHIEATVALGLGGGLLLTALTLVLAPLVAAPLFGGETAELFQMYAPVFTIAGLMIVPLAMLQRRLEFNRIGISEVASAAVTTLVAVVLAVYGLDAEAYVLGSLAGIAAWALVLMFFARMTPLPRWRHREVKEVVSTGAPAAGAGLAGIGTRNADYAILGAQLTSAQVGFYYRAFTIGVEYERKLSGIVTRIAFPVYSRTKDIDHLRQIRRRIVRLNATTVFPLLAFFIVVAPVLVPWMFGARWEPAVVLAQILAVAGMATTMKNTIDPLILATGRPRPLMIFNACEVALYVVMLILVSSGGDLVAVCAAVSAFRVAALLASYRLLLGGMLDISLRELLSDAGAALAACLVLVGVALPVRLELDADALPLLLACATASFPAYALALRILSPKAFADFVMVARRMLPARWQPRGKGGGDLVAEAV